VVVALAVMVGLTTLTQRELNREVTHVLAQLEAVAEHTSAEEFVDYIDKRKEAYPSLIILLAQRNKVRTLSGSEGFQTRWRAGTLRIVEWPIVPSAGSARPVVGPPGSAPMQAAAAPSSVTPKPLLSDWILVSAYRGRPDTVLTPIKVRARYAYFPEREAIGQPGLLLIVGRDQKTGEATWRPMIYAAIALLVVAPFFVAMSAFFTARFVVSNLDEIAETSNNIIGGDLSQRVPIGKTDDEFARLSATLNKMLDRIERLLNGMREVSDNIAHDLRTPLYRLRSRIELALINVDTREPHTEARDALEVALKEAERLLATFSALLSIARLEAGATRENTRREDLSEIVRDVAELYEPVAEEQGLRIVSDASPGLCALCHRELVVQALSNLVDNALKYSPQGTVVTLGARSVQPPRGGGRAVEATVTDEGPGIPPEDRERVLKRFVRLERGRGAPGSGLGLSLVAAIVQLHEAALTLEDGPNGAGLCIRLTFAAA
jgi:signal transduction histidine kinase